MSSWSPTTPELPRSVRGLFSQFGPDSESESVAKGLEKRLEIDMIGRSPIILADLEPILDTITCKVSETKIEGDILFAICDRAMLVVSPSKIIFTANADVPIHKAVELLHNLVLEGGGQVEWVSFVRKNFSAPWDAENKLLAAEYRELKHAFPDGNSYLMGPLDSYHYFYFVFDACSCGAKELQVNMVLHDIALTPDHITKYGLKATLKSGGLLQQCFSVSPGEYELIRVMTDDECHLSFETNATSVIHNSRLQDLVAEFQPAKFSLKHLVDPLCPAGEHIATAPVVFPGYTAESHATNEFLSGYVVNKTTYTRDDLEE